MKICPKLLVFELSDCTLRVFRGYEFSIISKSLSSCYLGALFSLSKKTIIFFLSVLFFSLNLIMSELAFKDG